MIVIWSAVKTLVRPLLTVLLLAVLVLSCQRSQDTDQQICYYGRYVGQGCWPVIQLLKPVEGIPTTQYGNFEHSIGTGLLPEKYMDGKPFYFTINQIDSNKIYPTYCIPTKYILDITPSDSACILNRTD